MTDIVVHPYFLTETDSELEVPYYKTHLENGYDAVLAGCEGSHGRYRLIMFDSESKLISATESHESFKTSKSLFDWANQKIEDQFPREFIINDAAIYLDKHVIDDADVWAKMCRESAILERRRKRLEKKLSENS